MQSNTNYFNIAIGVLVAASTCYLTYKLWGGKEDKSEPAVGSRRTIKAIREERKSVAASYTLDFSRLHTLDMLVVTKVKETDCIKIIAECIENETPDLKVTCSTLVGLEPILGFDYYRGNISHRGRYQSLVIDPYQTFIKNLIDFFRSTNF
jgi:hypothetical protein